MVSFFDRVQSVRILTQKAPRVRNTGARALRLPLGGGREPSPPNTTGRIGGMFLIVSNKWSKHIKDWCKDPSGSGVVSSVTIKAMSQDITIFGTYWPFMRVGAQTSEASGSLWNQLLEQYLLPNGLQENPREYVEGHISQQMVRRLGK